MVRRFSKRRSKHALNSIHKSCKLQNNWFKCDGLDKREKNTYSPICQTLFPPLMSMCCTNAISQPGIRFLSQRPRSFWCWAKGWGREGREWVNYRKQKILSKVIAGIAQRDGNVSFLFITTKYAWDANCLLAVNAQCLNKTKTLRDIQPVKALHTARFRQRPKGLANHDGDEGVSKQKV